MPTLVQKQKAYNNHNGSAPQVECASQRYQNSMVHVVVVTQKNLRMFGRGERDEA